MKIAIITDQHFGARKGSKLFHDYFEKFYDGTFFPTLLAEGITSVIDMGDTSEIWESLCILSWVIILPTTKTITQLTQLIYFYESMITSSLSLTILNM